MNDAMKPQPTSPHSMEDTAASWVFRREAGLTAREQEEFERWRAEDPQRAIVLARQERAWAALDRPRQGGTADFLLGQLAERASRRRRKRAGIAGGALVALLLAMATFLPARRHPEERPGASVVVVLPEKRILTDGSIVELKAGANITVDFNGPSRRVVLTRGEAHFQVAPQARPFVVQAGHIEFRAVGTAFNVQLASAGIALLVTEGKVAIDRPLTRAIEPVPGDLREPVATAATLATVAAGNRIVVALPGDKPEALSPATAVPSEEIAEQLAWRAPRLEFTDTPLAEAIALMNRHSRTQLIIEAPELRRLQVSGLFRADRTEAFVRLLEANFGVRAETTGETIYLHRRH